MKKTELTLKQMVEAVKENGKEPWEVVGIKRRTWFDIIKRNGLTMTALRSADSADSASTSETETPVRHINPDSNVGRGGVRYKYTDTEKYNKMKTKEVAQICGVSIPTVTENAKKVGIILENGKTHEWTEEELKRVQVQLMKNTTSRGNATTLGKVVEETALNALKGGLTIQELIRSGNVEAIKEFTQMAIEAAEQQNALIETQKQNRLLLEQKKAAEEETERIYQCNKNFHNSLYTASQIAKKLGITANMVGRIANEHGLKQDPIYGKLGKIQLNNGQWVNQFYYNDDALTVIEAVIKQNIQRNGL